MSSKQDDLNAARAARTAILAGRASSYKTAIGREVRYLDLAELNSLIDQLEGDVALESISGENGPSRLEIGLSSVDRAM